MRRWVFAACLATVSCESSDRPGQRSPSPRVEEAASTRRSEPTPAPLEVLYEGCFDASADHRCALTSDARTLTVWVDEPEVENVRVSIDGQPTSSPPVSAEHGLRWSLTVPPEARALTVQRPTGDAEPFTLALETVDERRATKREQRLADSRKAFAAGRASDWAEPEITAFRALVDQIRAEGHWTLAADNAYQFTFWFIGRRRDLVRGHEWLGITRDSMPFEDDTFAYLRGLLAETRGDLGEALRAHRSALHSARALGGPPIRRLSPLVQLMLLRARTGDRAGAIEIMGEALALIREGKVEPADLARFLDTAAWSLLLTSGSADAAPSPFQPRELLERARVLSTSDKQDVWITIRLNLAFDALERSEPGAARGWLDALAGRQLGVPDERWRRLLLARLDRMSGDLPAAQRRLAAMMTDAAHGEELQWAARVEHARVLEELGRPEDALAEYAEAERMLEAQLPLLGLGDRERFLVGRDGVTQRRVEMLLDQGQIVAALCAARLARTRALRSLDQRIRRDADEATRRDFDRYLGTRLRLDEQYEETFTMVPASRGARRQAEIERERQANERRFESILWAQGREHAEAPSCESLPTPGPEGLDLHYIRLARGWVGFAVDEHGAVVHAALPELELALREADEAALGRILLGPFSAALDRTKRVRINATGPLFGVTFHALQRGDGATRLQDTHTVVYGLDLPRVGRRDAPEGPAVVLQPPSNLPHAREEASLSASTLRSQRAANVLELGRSSDTNDTTPLSARVLAALPSASWLHYVGHARSDGSGGWDSELVLAADGSATVGVADILALPSVPPVVILSGCETGVVDPRSRGGGMSLAHAFVLAGAQVVIATTENIDDADASSLMRRLYGAVSGLDPDALVSALSAAQREAAAAPNDSDTTPTWRLTRAWVP